jgi:hypothetical protein
MNESATMKRLLSVISFLACFGCTRPVDEAKKPKIRITDNWQLFVPSENMGDDCHIDEAEIKTPSGEPAIRLWADYPMRFAITPRKEPLVVRPGDRYRISAWVKGGEDFKVDGVSAGLVLRVTMTEDGGKGSQNRYVGLRGTSVGANSLRLDSFPVEWTRLDGTIEIPNGINRMKFFVFSWWAKGSGFVDRPLVERVAPDSPLTPLL